MSEFEKNNFFSILNFFINLDLYSIALNSEQNDREWVTFLKVRRGFP